MSYETQNIMCHILHVKVNSESRFSRTLPMNVAINSTHRHCDKFVQGLGLVKDVWNALLNVIKDRAVYQCVHSRPLSPLMPHLTL